MLLIVLIVSMSLLLLVIEFISAKIILMFYTFSGLIEENNIVTSDKAEEIGAWIQQSLDHVSFTETSLWRKDYITTLEPLFFNCKWK